MMQARRNNAQFIQIEETPPLRRKVWDAYRTAILGPRKPGLDDMMLLLGTLVVGGALLYGTFSYASEHVELLSRSPG